MQTTLKKYVLPEHKVLAFVRHAVTWDLVIIISYSIDEVFNGFSLVVYVSVQDGEISAILKEEKLKEHYSRYEKTISA